MPSDDAQPGALRRAGSRAVAVLDNPVLDRVGNLQALVGVLVIAYGITQALGAVEGSGAVTLVVIVLGVVVLATSFLWHRKQVPPASGDEAPRRKQRPGSPGTLSHTIRQAQIDALRQPGWEREMFRGALMEAHQLLVKVKAANRRSDLGAVCAQIADWHKHVVDAFYTGAPERLHAYMELGDPPWALTSKDKVAADLSRRIELLSAAVEAQPKGDS